MRRLIASLGLSPALEAVVHGAGRVMLIQAAGSALAYGTQVLLARWMGAFEFGAFVYAWSWAMMLPPLGALGLNKAVLRFVPEYMATERWSEAAGVIRRSRSLTLLGASVVACTACLCLWLLGARVPLHYQTSLYIAFATVPPLALLLLYSELARGLGWAAMAYAPTLVLRPTTFVIAVALLAVSPWPLTNQNVMALAFGTVLITTVGVLAYFARRLPAELARAKARFRTAHWLRVAMPLLVTEGIFMTLWQLDVVMLGAMRGPDEVAVYNACNKTAGLALFMFTAFVSIATPRFAALHASEAREHEELQDFVHTIAKWTFWPSLAVVGAVLVSGEHILALFGESFTVGYPLLVLMVIAYVLPALTGPTREYLMVSGHHDSIVPMNACAGLVNVSLNALLIPRFGGMGAGCASFAALAVLTIWNYVLVRRRLGLNAFFLSLR